MYEQFYGFTEKPFSLLPDSGFLYLSGKHRMALTLLEYGLMNQAGFTVISGDIGTGKTTLIRQLLNQLEPELRVGLISNTHQTFGDLLQWIALAFDLPHRDKTKVELYQDFMDFVIGEYAGGRRTVLIVDEAQNMSAETLEELRMLSNVNADKDQVLQVILVGQRELRDTLQRPDLVQFAQRIGVDYHLEPLHEDETTEYIRHRCKTAGGREDLFTDEACEEVYRFASGVPRLINQICDMALVYGYAEQKQQIDATVVGEAAREKRRGGLAEARQSLDRPRNDELAATVPVKSAGLTPRSETVESEEKTGSGDSLRIAIAAESQLLRTYLARLLAKFDIYTVTTVPLNARDLHELDAESIDILLIEMDEHFDRLDETLYELLNNWTRPVLYNDSLATEASLSLPHREDYGKKLSGKLLALATSTPQSVA